MEGVIYLLRPHVSGRDFQHVCATCKALRSFATLNRKLWTKKHECWPPSIVLPLGITGLEIHINSWFDYATLRNIEIPTTVKSVRVNGKGDEKTIELQFPESVRSLELRSSGTMKFSPPSSLRVLKMSVRDRFFININTTTFPEFLIRLEFPRTFNQPVDLRYLKHLRVLKFGYDFCMDWSHIKLPSCLRVLRLGHKFNHAPKSTDLPEGLRKLKFGQIFNQPLDGLRLPPNLKTLMFLRDFNQPLSKVHFPASFEKLVVGTYFRHTVHLPSGVKLAVYKPRIKPWPWWM